MVNCAFFEETLEQLCKRCGNYMFSFYFVFMVPNKISLCKLENSKLIENT